MGDKKLEVLAKELERKRRIRVFVGTFLRFAYPLAFVSAFAALFYQLDIIDYRVSAGLVIVILSTAFGYTLALFSVRMSRDDLRRNLRALDKFYDTKDLLTASLSLPERGLFSEIVEEEVAKRIKSFDAGAVYRFPERKELLAPFFSLLFGLVFLLVPVKVFPSQGPVHKEDLFLDQASKLRQEALREDLPNTLLLSLELEELARAYQEDSVSELERLDRSRRLLDRLDEQIRGLERMDLPELPRRTRAGPETEGEGFKGRVNFGGRGLAQPDKARNQLRSLQRGDGEEGEDFADAEGQAGTGDEKALRTKKLSQKNKAGKAPSNQDGDQAEEGGEAQDDELLKSLEGLLSQTSRRDLDLLKSGRKSLQDAVGKDLAEQDASDGNEEDPLFDEAGGDGGPGSYAAKPGTNIPEAERKQPGAEGSGEDFSSQQALAGGPALDVRGKVLSEDAARFVLRSAPGAETGESASADEAIAYARRNEAVISRNEMPPNLRSIVESFKSAYFRGETAP